MKSDVKKSDVKKFLGKHKHSKYITIMFVPEKATSRVRSFKIKRWVLFASFFSIALLVSTLILFKNNINKAQATISSINSKLELTNNINVGLSTKNQQFNEALQEQQNSYENVIEVQKSTYETEIKKQSDEYQQKLQKLEEKTSEVEKALEELEKAREEIYDKMSSKNVELTRHASSSIVAMGGPIVYLDNNISTEDKLANSLDNLYATLDFMQDEFENISTQIDDYLAYKEACPSMLPVIGTFTSYVGTRSNPFGGSSSEYHSGLDIAVSYGTSVKATGAGKVVYSGWESTYGNLVVIDHGYGIKTYYGHNSSLLVKVGDNVTRGTVIAKSGSSGRSTGPHVHYELQVYGVIKNPLDYVD